MIIIIITSVVTGWGHPYYLGHLGHFLSVLEWVSPGQTYITDLDQNYVVIM